MPSASDSRLPREHPLLWKALPILLPLASLAVAVILAEGVLRLLGFAQVVQFDYVPDLGWVQTPNQDTRTVGGWPVHINSAGFRGPEVSLGKPAGTLRVLLIGDSFTFGYGVADDSTLAVQLQREFAKASRDCPRVEVINGGVNGYDTDQEVMFLRRVGLLYHPDVVILGFNPNDIMRPEEGRTMLSHPGLKRLLTRSALYQFLAPRLKSVVFRKQGGAYSRTVDDLIAGNASVTSRLERVRSAIASLDTSGHQHAYRAVVAVFPFMEHVYETAKGSWPPEALRTLEHSPGIPVFDALPALRARAQGGSTLFLDEPTHHPNPTALAVISRELSKFLTDRGLLPSCVTGAPVP
jgi:lysophospholipase L1-like esterase